MKLQTTSSSYDNKRGKVKDYFDITAADTWAKLTSDAPVSKIRATVRAGRDRMRATLLSWLPDDLSGTRLLDAGCGTGALALEAAKRGAHVVAVDLSPTLVNLARERLPAGFHAGQSKGGCVEFHAGDLLDASFGEFDYVVSMDCLIHYNAADAVSVLSKLAQRTKRSMIFTYAPSSPALMMMWTVGKMFPRKDRSPSIEPVRESDIKTLFQYDPVLTHWHAGRTERIKSGFYTSQALELKKQ